MYYQPATGQVIAGHSEARSALPNVIFPAILDDEMLGYHGIFPLVSVKPDVPPGQIAEGFGVELVDGMWTQLWTVRDATPEELEQPSEAEVVAAYMAAVQRHMDAHAVSFGYDNLLSVVSYAEEPAVPRYQAEGQAFRTWRSACWHACEQMLEAVKSGERSAPTHAELIAELPELGIEHSGPFAPAT